MPESVICPNCSRAFREAAGAFAANITCPHCGCLFRTAETAEVRYADEGYKLDFSDFNLVLRDASPDELNAAVFRVANLRYISTPEGPAVFRSTGGAVSLQTAHVIIQENASAQRGLYNLAMALWR
jgi:hypothetical protein